MEKEREQALDQNYAYTHLEAIPDYWDDKPKARLHNITDIDWSKAKKPLLVFGWGVHLAKAEKEAIAFAEKTGIPVVCSWAAADLFKRDNPLYIGTFGTHAPRYGNFAVQNSDFLIVVGCRLDTKATASRPQAFAPHAQVWMVDIDQDEIRKFDGKRDVHGIVINAKAFLTICRPMEQSDGYPEWVEQLHKWKAHYQAARDMTYLGGIDPLKFCEELSDYLEPSDVIVTDTGCSLGWLLNGFQFNGQRLIHAFNQTPMGYAIPAAIGAAFATGNRVVVVSGDGGFGVNTSELATLAKHDLPIKIILFNNRGHAMCRQTQRTWMNGEYPATSDDGGLACPNYSAIAEAYAIPVYQDVDAMFSCDGPGFLELKIHEDYQITPQVRAGRGLEDADPLLSREELAGVMA